MNSLRAFRPFFNALDHYAATTTPALWHSPPSSSLLGALSSAAGYPPVTIQEKGKGYESESQSLSLLLFPFVLFDDNDASTLDPRSKLTSLFPSPSSFPYTSHR